MLIPKALSVGLTLLTSLSGLAMLAVGIYALANPHSLVGDFITSAIPIVFIVIGALLFALTTIGLIWLSYSRGGTREQLRNDVVGMGLLCLLLTLILILTLAYEYRALHIIDSTWSQYFRNDWDRLENIQRRFQCCGFNSLLDRDVPRLSPVSTFHFRVQSYGSNVNTAFSPDFQEQDVKRCAESKEFGYHQPCAPQLATRFHHDMFPLTAVILITLALAVLSLMFLTWTMMRLPPNLRRQEALLAEHQRLIGRTLAGAYPVSRPGPRKL